MPHIYPPAPPTLSGDILTISRFLNSPALVQRRLRTIAEARFLADSILQGRYEASGGALLYEQTESIYTSKPPEAVNAGAEYPRTPATPGPAALAGITKWGSDVPITDEHVKRYGRRAVDVALLKITNYVVKQVDTVAMTAINAAVTLTQAVQGSWTVPVTATDPIMDILLAAAQINSQDQGYTADTVVTTDQGWARLMGHAKLITGSQFQGRPPAEILSEILPGMRVLPTNNTPPAATDKLWVLDSTMLGGLAYERLESPEYAGDPANGMESWTRRDPAANDQWLVRGRRPIVPVVQEPKCIVQITGSGINS